MKKLIIAATATAALALGGMSAHAKSPDPDPLPDASLPLQIECSERDEGAPDIDGDGIADECVDFYVDQDVNPPTTTVAGGAAATTTTVATSGPGTLPRTGSGVSPILGIGALLFVGGGIVVVASRRRTRSAPA